MSATVMNTSMQVCWTLVMQKLATFRLKQHKHTASDKELVVNLTHTKVLFYTIILISSHWSEYWAE